MSTATMTIPSISVAKLTRGEFPVIITEVDSPGRFWVQPRPSQPDIREFLEELNWKMERTRLAFPYWAHQLRPGAAVAIKRGKHWQRGVVFATHGSRVRVQLKDWGQEVTVPVRKVHQLPKRFHESTWKAFECTLADAKPVGGHATWSSESCMVMEDLTRGKEAWIRIQGVTEENVARVRVTIRGGIGGEDLHEVLAKQGCAI